VYPTRTARFGVALVTKGSIRLKGAENASLLEPVDPECACLTCRDFTRAYLHLLFKENCPLAAQLLTRHNISYMMRLMRSMRQAILDGKEAYQQFVLRFLQSQFVSCNEIPLWVKEALTHAGLGEQLQW
jgi:queuine tRNA-ribosyltransferase catalytic subunit